MAESGSLMFGISQWYLPMMPTNLCPSVCSKVIGCISAHGPFTTSKLPSLYPGSTIPAASEIDMHIFSEKHFSSAGSWQQGEAMAGYQYSPGGKERKWTLKALDKCRTDPFSATFPPFEKRLFFQFALKINLLLLLPG